MWDGHDDVASVTVTGFKLSRLNGKYAKTEVPDFLINGFRVFHGKGVFLYWMKNKKPALCLKKMMQEVRAGQDECKAYMDLRGQWLENRSGKWNPAANVTVKVELPALIDLDETVDVNLGEDPRQLSTGISSHLGMAPAELFFSLLEDGYPLEGLKKIDLEGFDWSSRHESGQTLLVVHIANAMIQPQERFEDALETIEWLIRSGASTEQKCTGGQWNFCRPHKPETPAVPVQCKGLSAISFVRAVAQKMRTNLKDWKREEAFLVKVTARFAAAFSLSAAPRVTIHKGIAELWEKSLAAKDSHDLTIVTADGLVTAHAHMLKAASAVVAAMLGSPMKAGKAQRIEIKDTSGKAVSLILEILYTCSVPGELDHQSALHALDLAHRWQVDVAVAILSDLLAGMITDESFSVIMEHAILKGLERLKAAAQRFGAESKKVQADLKAGRLPTVVALLFHGGSPSKSKEPKPKRRRV